MIIKKVVPDGNIKDLRRMCMERTNVFRNKLSIIESDSSSYDVRQLNFAVVVCRHNIRICNIKDPKYCISIPAQTPMMLYSGPWRRSNRFYGYYFIKQSDLSKKLYSDMQLPYLMDYVRNGNIQPATKGDIHRITRNLQYNRDCADLELLLE